MSRVVLTLDLATTTGWCLGRLGAEPIYGAWFLGDDHWGRRFARLADAIVEKVKTAERRGAPVERIYFEAPLPRQQKTDNVAALAWGYSAITMFVAGRLQIQHGARHCGTARAAVLGTARFPPGKVKQGVDHLCRLQGWHIDQDDARDAFVLWKHEELKEAKRLGLPVRLPMRRETLALPGL